MFYKFLEFRNNLVEDIKNKYKNNEDATILDVEKYMMSRLSEVKADTEDKTELYQDVLMELNSDEWFRKLNHRRSLRQEFINL